MHNSISDTAEFGDYLTGPQIIDEHTRGNMRQALKAIQDGSFARNWILENQAGQPMLKAWRKKDAAHQIESVGAQMRQLLP